MTELTLPQIFEMKIKLKELETQIASGELSLLDRCDVEDEILELKLQLGEFERGVLESGSDCINCSG
jgi:hypothetical protein